MKGIKNHAKLSEAFKADEPRVDWHDETLWFIRQKRDKAANSIPEWEYLRELGSQIKNHTLSNLDQYLIEFEKNAIGNGISVHWAADAKEHNDIVLQLILKNNIQRIVKSKSMLTEECGLNAHLLAQEIQVVDTDLGERIVQLRKEHPNILPTSPLCVFASASSFSFSFTTVGR